MKQLFYFVIVAFALGSCGSKTKEKIELNLKVGETYTMNTTGSTKVIQKFEGEKMVMDMEVNGVFELKVIAIKDFVYEMECRYQKLSMKVDAPEGKGMSFDSESIDTTNIYSVVISSMIGKPFNLSMNRQGKVLEVTGIDALFANCFEKFPELTEEQKEMILAQTMKSYGNEAFKGNIEQATAFYPDEPMAVGDTWKTKVNLESGMSGELTTEYTLKEVGDTYFIIEGEGDIETADKDSYIDNNGMPTRYDLKGKSKNEIKIDKATGWIIESTQKNSMKGKVRIKSNPQLPNGLEIDMELTAKTKTTGK